MTVKITILAMLTIMAAYTWISNPARTLSGRDISGFCESSKPETPS